MVNSASRNLMMRWMKSCTRLEKRQMKFLNWDLRNTLRSKNKLNTSIGFKKISGVTHGWLTGSVSTRLAQSDTHGKISADSDVKTNSLSCVIGSWVQLLLGLLLPQLVVLTRLVLVVSLPFLYKDGYMTSQRVILAILHAKPSATTRDGLVSLSATSLLEQSPITMYLNKILGTTGLTWSHSQPWLANQTMLPTTPW